MKFHIIYKITCKVTNKYYVGMHSTYDVNDSYMGSGKIIRSSIKKHGLQNHVKIIVASAKCRNDLIELERQIVNEQLLTDPLCMNLKIGGDGFDSDQIKSYYKDASIKEKHRNNLVAALNDPSVKDKLRSRAKRLWENESYRAMMIEKFKKRTKSESHRKNLSLSLSGKKQSPAHILKNSEKNKLNWIIITPTGVIETYDLDDFCKLHSINKTTLRTTLKRKTPLKNGFMLIRPENQHKKISNKK